jgi:hypothetical protein
MKMLSPRSTLIGTVCLALLLGCGGGSSAPKVKTYPVTGSVAYNGQPLAGAVVVFKSDDEALPGASGITDKEGKFTLSTYSVNDGAPAGLFKITVTKDDPSKKAAPMDESMLNDPSKMMGNYSKSIEGDGVVKKATFFLPAKYASHTTTPLSETVKAEGTNNCILHLSDDA